MGGCVGVSGPLWVLGSVFLCEGTRGSQEGLGNLRNSMSQTCFLPLALARGGAESLQHRLFLIHSTNTHSRLPYAPTGLPHEERQKGRGRALSDL